MSRAVPLLLPLFLSLPAVSQDDLSKLLRGVEDRYNRPRTIQMRFEQSQSATGQITRTESGDLFLKKPGLMRWQYEQPSGKFFLTDGRFSYLYSPGTGQVSRSRLKESEDLRAPLGFLMGRLDFERDFREFRTTREGANVYIVASPRSARAPYSQVEFLVAPGYRIEMLKVVGQDGSVMRYRLSGEKLNPAISDKTFQFTRPDGAEVIDESGD